MNHAPRTLSVIAAALATALPVAAFAAPPAGSPYNTDPQSSHVQDATSERIGTVNMVVCIMNALAPDKMVNQGNYVALVDENACNGKKDSAANSSASGGATSAPSYSTAVVNSTRATNNDPMAAKIWINQDDLGGVPGTIFVKLSASESPTVSNPYGVFRLDFAGRPTGVATTMMNGMLDAAATGLQFYQHEDRGGGQTQVTQLALTASGTTTGSGEVKTTDTNGGVTTTADYTFAYDASYFRRSDGTTDLCFSRDASAPNTGYSVWRYGLYDATTGNRIDLQNPGFPITYTDGGNVTYQGYLGYWGLSLPPAAMSSIATGSHVTRASNGGGAQSPQPTYTVVRSGGKLTRYTKHTRTLQSLDQIRFNTWYGSNTPLYTNAPNYTQFEMYWDDASQLFVVDGVMSCGNSGCTTVSLSGTLPTVSASVWQTQGGIAGWSDALGGDVFIDLSNPTAPSSAINVVYRSQDTVYPDQMPPNLYCVQNCPTAADLQGYFVNNAGSSPYSAATYNQWNATTNVVTYTTDATQGVIVDPTVAPVVLPANANIPQSSPYYNGVRSGRMVDTLSFAECSPSSQTYCDSSIGLAQVYYVWENGSNPWNQFVGVKDANNQFVRIDPPMQVSYTVPNDSTVYGGYAGKQITLQYGGFGQLNGIPGTCVSQIDNSPALCSDSNARWVSQFAIPAIDPGTNQPSTVTYGSTTYLVKWLDREIRFAQLSLGTCTGAGLALPNSLTLPQASSTVDPSDPNGAAYIGTKPAVTTPPAVIQGVLQ